MVLYFSEDTFKNRDLTFEIKVSEARINMFWILELLSFKDIIDMVSVVNLYPDPNLILTLSLT